VRGGKSVPDKASLPGDARQGGHPPFRMRSLSSEVRDALIRDERIQQCYFSGQASVLKLSPALEPAVLVEVLAAAEPTVSTFLDELEAHQLQHAEATASLIGELREAITLRQLRPESHDQLG
jgi:hypothetical protein